MALTSEQLAALKQASHEVLDEAVAFLQALIRVDTTNPPGLNYRQVANVIKDELERLDYKCELLAVEPGDLPALAPHDADANERVNVLGRRAAPSLKPNMVTVDGITRQKTIHFNGHTDVVPAGDLSTWTKDPFGGEVVDGRIYGRGVSDMKGGIAAGVWAAEVVKRAGLILRGTVEHSGCVDEESTGVRNAGAGWLVEEGHISAKTVDGIVITEPLNVDNVCLGHRGAIWGTIVFKGVASHGASPQLGVNALVHASTFVVRAKETIMPLIEGKREERVIPAEARGASLTFTVLKAGANTNSVPDLAILRFDRRLVPSETLEEARAQIQSVLDEVSKEIPELDYTYHEDYSTEPVWVDETLEICKTWAEAVETVLEKKAGIVCSPGSDDQRFFVRGGMPQTIVYGPGNIKQVHNKDESMPLEDYRIAMEVMAIGMCEFLGVD
ncbi:succinyl-diaminopimelate desuccinylase [Leucosporidium creatinivorum]|uniref:Succinyl-diaminopimelate desuccinylase n=1 Tax=Leucosporidium creatinivorum TaxID=106004 RepID=A0A1Y2G210_9BASI|nr:succinyl-diaminopimelate desuccinylase [Leucosporidium creatinivorum]